MSSGGWKTDAIASGILANVSRAELGRAAVTATVVPLLPAWTLSTTCLPTSTSSASRGVGAVTLASAIFSSNCSWKSAITSSIRAAISPDAFASTQSHWILKSIPSVNVSPKLPALIVPLSAFFSFLTDSGASSEGFPVCSPSAFGSFGTAANTRC